ncbi:MAG: gliding motility-associated C-terminal domain-containing protein [Flavobacteriales bacterium]|jgi:gliding motility-associated-like protein|nr:MAG: gliding motility-associated C-terminal domain-containing protein [Flavobacteriales bacterium]
MRSIAMPLLLLNGFALAQLPACDVVLSGTPITCPGDDDATLSVGIVSGGPYTYSWAHDNTATGTTVGGLAPGAYSVFVTDGATCESSLDTLILDPVVPPLGNVAITHISCTGESDGAFTLTLGPGGPFTWFWTHDPTNTSLTLTGMPGNNYAAVIVPPVGCNSVIAFTLGDPDVTITGDPLTYCPSGPPLLTAQLEYGFEPDVYEWSTGALTPVLQVEPGTSGTITLTATDTTTGCVATDQVDVLELPAPFASMAAPDTACQFLQVLATTVVTDADSLVWRWGNEGFSNERDPLVAFAAGGWQPISLQPFAASGCGNVPVEDSVWVTPRLPAEFTVVQVPCSPAVEVRLSSVADSCAFFIGDSLVTTDCGAFFRWDHRRYALYDYVFYSTQPNRCDDTASVRLDVRTEPTLFLANAFTPNDDGYNDRWPDRVDVSDYGYELRVFNRWGQVVWETNDPAAQWDGGGSPMGVYAYTMRMRDPCQPTAEVSRTGHFTLFR